LFWPRKPIDSLILSGRRFSSISYRPDHEIAKKLDELRPSREADIFAQSIGFPSQYYAARDRDTPAIAALLSILLHLALLKWVIVYLQAPPASAPLHETEITLVSRSDIENKKAPTIETTGPGPSTPRNGPEIQARSPPADAPNPVERPPARPDTWSQSQDILSSQELADPRNRKTAESLKRLEPQTRSQQVCDLAAILQINRQFSQYAVDFVVAYATEAVVRKGDAIVAHGAAFHSNGQWYNLAFECHVATNQRDVAHLRFKLGDAIPGDQWADLNLPKAPANPLGGD
jgi:hypothetical protein